MFDILSNSFVRLAIAGGICYTVGDWFMKKWAIGAGCHYWIIAIVIWMLGMMILGNEYKYENMAVASMFVLMANMISLVFMSALCFNEPLTVTQIIGVVFGLITMYLLR